MATAYYPQHNDTIDRFHNDEQELKSVQKPQYLSSHLK